MSISLKGLKNIKNILRQMALEAKFCLRQINAVVGITALKSFNERKYIVAIGNKIKNLPYVEGKSSNTKINQNQINLLAPNDVYIRRTAQLTSKHCILNIYLTNILTEYFKHAAHSPFFFLQDAVYFITLPFLVPVILTF